MTPRYPNGRYPLNLFIHRGGDLYLSPSLNARWNEAVRLGLEKYGVRLYITGPSERGWDGANGYRWYDKQVQYKDAFGIWAASAGTSSHGGSYGGQEVFALDVANWSSLAPGNEALAWSRFVAIMRIVGLRTDFVTPREKWHVGDFNNAWVVPSFGQVTINPGTTNKPENFLEEDMPIIIAQRADSALAKGRYIGGGKIQEITRAENDLFRATQLQDRSAVIYSTISDASYEKLRTGSKA